MHLREGEFEKAHTDFFEVKTIDDLTAVSFSRLHLDQSFTSRHLRIMMNLGHLAEPHASNTWVSLTMELAYLQIEIAPLLSVM